ncbi:MAG: serine/threonine protein kinase [Deltaproteobacteria bacterium]|nr:serine/threonine protein kinase [Deltaproteobacteria bacterium]
MQTLPEFAAPSIPIPESARVPKTGPGQARVVPKTWEGPAATMVDVPRAAMQPSEPPHPHPEEREGRILGGAYQLLVPIGTGSTGAVYEARHLPSGQAVAVKVLREKWRTSDGQKRRFEREARAGSIIRHRHIVRLLDAGVEPDGTAWQVLELLQGRELATAVEQRPLAIEEAMLLARQLLEALQAVHLRGYVHRDVKPENVFLVDREDGRLFAKLLDFGIAKPMIPTLTTPALTEEGVILGTPQYMAPEQITGDLPVTPSSDLWALGAVLFTALAGRPPFYEAQLSTLLVKIAREPAPSVAYFRGDVPRRFAEILARALRTHPAHRYRDAAEMSEDLERCIADHGSLSDY